MIGPRPRRAIAVAFILAAATAGVAHAQTAAAPVGNFGGGAIAVPVDEKTVAKDMVLSMRAQSGGRLAVDGQIHTPCGLATIAGDAKLAAGGSFTSRGAVKTKPAAGASVTSTFVVEGGLTADGGTGTARTTLRVRVKGRPTRTCTSRTVSWTVRRDGGPVAAPGPAPPAESLLYGLTSQSGPHADRAIVLHSTSGGRSIDRVVVGFRAKCDRGRVTVADEVNFSPEFDVTAAGAFRNVEKFNVRFSDVVARVTVLVRGQFDRAGSAAGTLSVTERFTSRKTGKRVDVCATGTLTWSARP